MGDDKDESTPDPWAGIEDDGAVESADGFTFSFDASSEVEDQPQLPLSEELNAADVSAQPDADDASILRIDAVPDMAAEADPFASPPVEAGAEEDVADDISTWLSESDGPEVPEAPLAVFSPEGAEDRSPPVPTPEFDAFSSFDDPTDDVHATAEATEHAAMGSSHVEVGTGFSGIASPSEVDPPSGVDAIDDWAETTLSDAPAEDVAADEPSAFDASGFEGIGESAESGESGEAVGLTEVPFGEETVAITAAGAGAAAAVATAKPRSAVRPKGGGIGQVISIVLGGLMAIPITYAILIWGFQKDPFKLAGLVPEQVAFLLPAKFQPGFRKTGGGPKPDAVSTLDNLPAVAEATSPTEPAAEPPAPETAPATEPAAAEAPPTVNGGLDALAMREPAPKAEGEAATVQAPVTTPTAGLFDDSSAETKQPAPPPAPEPEPLDLAALEAAVGDAVAAHEALATVDQEAPDRKKLLVGWYKRLASVAEQFVLLEKVASDSGRTLDAAPDAVEPIYAAIADDPLVQGDLAKLSGMWLSSKKRPADGAVLLGTFEGTRQVGPYWSTRLTIAGADPRPVAVISRIEPRGDPGATVLVTGVLFDGDVVWASDCRPLEKKPAPVEDLF